MKLKTFSSIFLFTIFFNLFIVNHSRAHENDYEVDNNFLKSSLSSKSKIINNRIRGKARKSNSGCTKLVQNYNEDRNVDFQRLNYLVSNEKSIEEIKNNISFRKDNFQHQAYKKGCISLDGTPTAKVTSQTKREYEKMLNINIGKIFKNEYQP